MKYPRIPKLTVLFRQILFNLVGNALKFTESGAVLIDIAPTPDGVYYRVIDTGTGIAPEDRDRLFEAFRQSTASDAQKDGGVGLGLAIVGRLVDALGGEISVSGRQGSGTEFRVDLPLRPAVKPNSGEAKLDQATSRGERSGLAGLPPATALSAAQALESAGYRPLLVDPEAPKAIKSMDAIIVGADLPKRQLNKQLQHCEKILRKLRTS